MDDEHGELTAGHLGQGSEDEKEWGKENTESSELPIATSLTA